MPMQDFESSAETVEVATPSTESAETGSESTEVTTNVSEGTESGAEVTDEPTDEGNTDKVVNNGRTEEDSRFAAIRRKAEEDAKKKYEAEMANVNAEFKRMFGTYNNPITGKPIETYADYLQAVEKQQKDAQEAELRSKGVDPNLIEQMVNNSPAMRQAQAIIEQQKQEQINSAIESDFKKVQMLSPELKTLDDLVKTENYVEVAKYVNAGLNLFDAYKLANFETLSQKKSDAVKQAAINSAKSTSHMTTTSGKSVASESMVPIPDKSLAKWRDAFPNLTMEQLTAKYNNQFK